MLLVTLVGLRLTGTMLSVPQVKGRKKSISHEYGERGAGKANVVADALSHRGPVQLHSMRLMAKEIAEDMVRSEIELVVGWLSNITL